jgi:integrase
VVGKSDGYIDGGELMIDKAIQIKSRDIRRIKNRGGKPQYYARLRYRIGNGQAKEVLRKAEGKGDARRLLAQLETELHQDGPLKLEAGNITFRQLAEYCKENYYVPAVYDEHGTKISGVRSLKKAHGAINKLVEYFGDQDIRAIETEDLLAYKRWRTEQTDGRGNGTSTRKISIATAHRELSKARRMFNIARRKNWISANPFLSEQTIIQVSVEKKRSYILNRDEEQALLHAFSTAKRRHMLPIIIAALDTGARRSSLLEHLKWKHIDFANERLLITTYKDTNRKEWWVPMSDRLKFELLKLKGKGIESEALVFDGVKDPKTAFEAARREIGLPSIRFHDLRHTTATRLIASGVALEEVARILGHSDPKTTYRYVDLTKGTIDKVREAINRFNAPSALKVASL